MKLTDLDINKTYSYADYLKWKFDERIELIKGKIFKMSPAPSTNHQKISLYLTLELGNYLRKSPCQLFSAPFDVRLPRKSIENKEIITVLQPDLCVVCDPSKIDQKGCLGSPDIVVEILSPGNNKKELDSKFHVYEEALVKEYWIIHPDENTFFRYVLNNENKFIAERLLTSGSFVTTTILPSFKLDLEEMFNQKLEE
jgi:Uma2 family endonuclease